MGSAASRGTRNQVFIFACANGGYAPATAALERGAICGQRADVSLHCGRLSVGVLIR